MALNFVKFQRGSSAAYEALKTRHALESDALYFIYDKAKPQEGGLLYLGEVLIGGTGINGASQLSELSDVSFENINLLDGMVLQYQGTSGKWKPISIKSAIENSGASLSGSGVTVTSGNTQEGQTVEQVRNTLDPTPTEGDIVFVNGVPYIYDGNSWQTLTGQSIEDRLTLLENGLAGVDAKIANAIANANHLTYEVISGELPTITEQNVGDLSNKILLVADSNGNGTNIYREYIIIGSDENATYEELGTLNDINLENYVQVGDLNDYVTQSDFQAFQTVVANTYVTNTNFNAAVGDLNALAAAVEKPSTDLSTEMIALYERLKWGELDQTNNSQEG